eukprot:GFKZ01001761.1.p2 GENE.GFKZ01001761.1~~GFKZ01001761.1.p2  ORF type:complete len:130 (+),score=7.74 GFKZ01001761.1:1242-1631(+)
MKPRTARSGDASGVACLAKANVFICGSSFSKLGTEMYRRVSLSDLDVLCSGNESLVQAHGLGCMVLCVEENKRFLPSDQLSDIHPGGFRHLKPSRPFQEIFIEDDPPRGVPARLVISARIPTHFHRQVA